MGLPAHPNSRKAITKRKLEIRDEITASEPSKPQESPHAHPRLARLNRNETNGTESRDRSYKAKRTLRRRHRSRATSTSESERGKRIRKKKKEGFPHLINQIQMSKQKQQEVKNPRPSPTSASQSVAVRIGEEERKDGAVQDRAIGRGDSCFTVGLFRFVGFHGPDQLWASVPGSSPTDRDEGN